MTLTLNFSNPALESNVAVAVDHHLDPCFLETNQTWIGLSLWGFELVGEKYAAFFHFQSFFGRK